MMRALYRHYIKADVGSNILNRPGLATVDTTDVKEYKPRGVSYFRRP
jgi:hypothetical protein